MLIARDQLPDVLAFADELSLECLDERYFASIPGIRGKLLRRLPIVVAQGIEVVRRRRELDLVVSWSEAIAIPVALLLLLLPRRPAHLGILMWPSKPKKAVLLRLLRRGIDRLIIPAPQQRRFAVERLRVPETVAPPGMRWSVDTRFWRPSEGAGEMICCVGREMRDYSTFVEAIRPLEIPCHIAAGGTQGVSNPWLRLEERDLPANVTLGAMSPLELRELYRRSRFVVIPLIPSDSDNGISTALEAFAMGRAVICTDTAGQVGVLEDGVNCLLVPPGDAAALRAAIERLWADPALCHQLGAAGRALVERNHTVAQWVTAVGSVAEEAVTGTSTRRRSLAA